MRRIEEDFHIGFLSAEEILSPDQSIPGGDIGVARSIEEEIGFTLFPTTSFLQGAKNARLFKDFIHVASGSGNNEVAALGSDKANKIT